MDLGLAGKRAIVTGGSRGIGKAIVQTLLNEGAAVATCARGADALDTAVKTWREDGATVHGAAVDVTDDAAFSNWFVQAVDLLGGLDIFISNVSNRIRTEGLERWRDTFEVDLLQHVRGTDLALPHLHEGQDGAKDGAKDGAIVYISSIASVMTANMPTETEYGSMKAALISYGTQLANRVGRAGIRVNIVSPGPIHHENGFWEMVQERDPKLYKMAEAVSVFKRLGTPQEVANAAVFLASPAASNITAANLRVDGGAIKTVNF